MKLITRTSLYFFLISLVVLILAGTGFYIYFSFLLDEEINDQIGIDETHIREYAAKHNALPPLSPIAETIITFDTIQRSLPENFVDTILLSPLQDEYLPYRQTRFIISVKGHNYSVALSKPLFEKDDLLETLIKSLGIFFIFLLLILYLVSRWLSNKLWKPFYQSLNQLKEIDFRENRLFQLPHTTTAEFAQLNMELLKMTDRIHKQYNNLKEFSENASHEIQTPLGIVRNKLELLLQSGNQSEEEISLIQEAFESITRLSKLTQSLLLLSKIENRQFHENTSVDIRQLVMNKIELFEDIRQMKALTVEINMGDAEKITMNPHLADILLSNIIGNAYKHSSRGGNIHIEMKGKQFISTNTGRPLSVNADQLFHRFVKDAAVPSESPGLGLSIVREICAIYFFPIHYRYADGMHTISILFDTDRISPDSAGKFVS